jgi:Zn-dependent peptidase ImmA (M78 family)/DNA-binding XRE family transcriptional regulator
MNATFNPEMLILARESRGMTQGELADEVSISQGTISKIESGVIEVSDHEWGKIAESLKYPRHFFSQTDRVFGYGSACIYHRKRQSLPASTLRRLMASINVIRIQVSRLLRGAEIETQNKFYRMDISDYDGDAEHIAKLIKRYWGLPPGPVNNLTTAIELAGGIVIRCSFETDKIDAMSQWAPGLPPLFFINCEIPADRVRYTLAHEVGHIVMHNEPTPDMEDEANRFAAEFLMPADEIKAYLKPLSLPRLATLKPYWKVSMNALLKRAADLKVITSRQREYLWTQMGKQGFRTKEPISIPDEQPTVLSDLINVHLRDHGYSISELSQLIASTEEELRAKYLPPPPAFPKLRIVS